MADRVQLEQALRVRVTGSYVQAAPLTMRGTLGDGSFVPSALSGSGFAANNDVTDVPLALIVTVANPIAAFSGTR